MKREDISVIKTDRNSVSVSITKDLKIILHVPKGWSKAYIEAFIRTNMKNFDDNIEIIKKQRAEMAQNEDTRPFTYDEIKDMAMKAINLISPKVDHYMIQLGVFPSGVKIKTMRSRWGSCSSNGNISFNCLLALCPDDVIEYVVIHELCHMKHMNHSKEFWALVEKYCPQYKEKKAWLDKEGSILIKRLIYADDPE